MSVSCGNSQSSTLVSIERYLQQALVDKDELVASSALVSALHLLKVNPDVVKGWVKEAQTALENKSSMGQFHALALLHGIKKNDVLAISRLLTQIMNSTSTKSNLAMCMAIRYSLELIHRDPEAIPAKELYGFLESCLHHQSEVVIYEAARAICELPDTEKRDIAPAVTVLHMFLASSKSVRRFAAVKTLSNVAQRYPLLVAKCNEDLESLLHDSNRTIATLAITTLLKTGAEQNVDRFMRQINKFMADIGDEFKIVVVRAVHDLALRLPNKYSTVLNFLSEILRDEGGLDLKKAVVDIITDIIEKNEDATNPGLYHFCEYIEDCEYTALATRILHLLGDKASRQPKPEGFIRYIYNRIILENAVIRAAAVSALAKFAARVPSLRHSVTVLLRRCQNDDNDEVRDRATLYLTLLEEEESGVGDQEALEAATKSITAGTLPMSVEALQKSLRMYALRPAKGPLTFDALPKVEEPVQEQHSYDTEAKAAEKQKRDAAAAAKSASQGTGYGQSEKRSAVQSSTEAAEELFKIPEFANLGSLIKSTSIVPLTESELEYLVHVRKHIFHEYVVFDFRVENTMGEVELRNVRVDLDPNDEETAEAWEVTNVIAASGVKKGEPQHTYVCVQHNEAAGYPSASWDARMYFLTVEVDESGVAFDDAGIEEDFELEQVTLSLRDFMVPRPISGFKTSWEQFGKDVEVRDDFEIPFQSVEEAYQQTQEILGMSVCEDSKAIDKNGRLNALLAGVFMEGMQVLVKMQIMIDSQDRCILRFAARSPDKNLSQLVLDVVQ